MREYACDIFGSYLLYMAKMNFNLFFQFLRFIPYLKFLSTYLYNNNHKLTAPFCTGCSPRGVWYLVGKHLWWYLRFWKKKFKLGHGPPVAPTNVFGSLHKVHWNGHFENWFIKMICGVGQISNFTPHKPNTSNPYDPLGSPNTSQTSYKQPLWYF